MFPKVAIIYSAYPTPHWERDIPRCLSSLEKITYPKDRVELICFESKAKIPSIKEWFAQTWLPKSGESLPAMTYLFHDRWVGFAENNNLALEVAKQKGCNYVYLLNQDTDVEPDFLDRAIERAESDPSVAIVQSLFRLGDERDQLNSCGNAWQILGVGFSRGYHWDVPTFERWLRAERVHNPELLIAYAGGAGMLARISALNQNGGLFDEKFFLYHEDTDVSLRARIQGWKVVLEPSSVIYHYYEFNKAKINYYWMERNRYALVLMYYRLWTLFLMAPLFIAFDVAMWGFSILRGWYDMKWKVTKEFFSIDFWRWIYVRRKEMQLRRRVSDRELLSLSVTEILFQEASIKNPLLDHVGNPLMRWYWWAVKRLVSG